MLPLLTTLVFLTLFIYVILSLPVFGKLPIGERKHKIENLSQYQHGAIANESPTPMLPPDVSYWQMFRKVIKGNKNGMPKYPLPHIKPDFANSDELKIIWFGHSSYLIQVDGKNILVDPVFSERPSPFQFIGTKRFKGTDFIEVEDLPNMDVVLITHDHYDHLDYHSILKLKDRTTHFVTSTGVGSHLEFWGIGKENIIELSWNETATLADLIFVALPARHFSGRKFKRNQTLWSSFALKTKNHKIYIGGDSGFDSHFAKIGEEHGPFDLAILECGQYNTMWPLIHMFPEQLIIASDHLNAKRILPVHWGKYRLALHDWDEPIKRLHSAAKANKVELVTPRLGESYFLGNAMNEEWWTN